MAAINAAGAVVVAAAGNSEGLAAGSPANCPGVIGVSALRHVGTKVGFSDVGPEISIAAPGGNCVNVGANQPCLYPILTTADSGTKGPVSPIYTDSFNASLGTSFSSPLVAATAALMLSVQPSLTPAAVRAAIMSSARPFPASGLPPDPTTGSARCLPRTQRRGAGPVLLHDQHLRGRHARRRRGSACGPLLEFGDRGLSFGAGARAGDDAVELRRDARVRTQHP